MQFLVWNRLSFWDVKISSKKNEFFLEDEASAADSR